MVASSDIRSQYPKQIRSTDGREFTIRLMEPSEVDRSAVTTFANKLNEDDLLYLRTDITDPAVIAQWIQNLRTGNTTTLKSLRTRWCMSRSRKPNREKRFSSFGPSARPARWQRILNTR